MGEKETNPEEVSHAEDIALKAGMEFFGKEILPLLGETEKILHVAPTEKIRLEARRMYEDFTFVMKNGKWYHFEFESDPLTTEDLRRFREYEAATGRVYGVEMVTCVICTANVKNPVTELRSGINTYRVRLIHTREKSAERVFQALERKRPEKKDLLPVTFSPLLGGNMPQKERVKKGFTLLRDTGSAVGKEELVKMQAILYLLAVKFLNREEMEEVKEEISMTVLGQMLVDDGIQKGIQKGVQQGVEEGKAAGKAEALLELLEELGNVPKALRDKILDCKDLTVLKGWFKTAMHAKSVEEFKEKAGMTL